MSWESIGTQALTLAAALGGALVAHFTSHGVKRLETRNTLMAQEIKTRETLYSDLITEVARISSLVKMERERHALPMLGDLPTASEQEFYKIAVLLGHIRLIATPAVVSAAVSFSEKAKTYRKGEARKWIADSIAEFSEVCRVELDALRAKHTRINE